MNLAIRICNMYVNICMYMYTQEAPAWKGVLGKTKVTSGGCSLRVLVRSGSFPSSFQAWRALASPRRFPLIFFRSVFRV